MYDKYNRKINYLRISVTDRCNLRCVYCMPAEGIELISHKEILSFDEIYEAAKVAVSMGVDKIRITGGEPLVRKDIVELIKMIASINGIKDLGMTTNGKHLPHSGMSSGEGELLYRVPNQPSIDGNTVDTQEEMAEFTKNTMNYQASLHFLNGRFKALNNAIRGE